MLLRKTIIAQALFFFAFQVASQNLEKLERKAQKLFYAEDLENAAQAYQDLLDLDSEHRIAKYRWQVCQLLLQPGKFSIDDLLVYRSTQGRRDKFYFYWLGRAYFHQNQFKKAIESWNKFLTVDKYKSSIIIKETEFFIDWAERAEVHHSFPENYEIEHLPDFINSTADELSPVFFSDKKELLFLSSKSSSGADPRFKVYHTIKNDYSWTEPDLLRQFDEFSWQQANIEVVDNASKLYFYRGNKKGELFVSNNSSGKWGSPRILDKEISDSRLESHFFVNEQENTILFAHRKKGNTADLDIFVTRLDAKGNWTKPAPFSPVVNSEQDEDYPFLTEDGRTLYFSSKGFESIGGYDVFKSELDPTTGEWSVPQGLGYPTNSIADDIQFKINESTNSGYFVSDRLSSMGGYDIYFFHKSGKILLSGKVLDGTGQPASEAEIHFYPSRSTGLELRTMTDGEGAYQVKVGGEDQIKVEIFFHDELVHRGTLQTPAAQNTLKTVRQDFYIDQEKSVLPEVDLAHDPTYSDLENIGSKFRESNKALLSNIYFDFGKVALKESEKPKLEPLLEVMKENPELHIEIAGHTDDIGDGIVNLRISILRARSVAGFLTDHGITQERVIAKGYGYAIPMASNDQEREGREFNRRIEVLVIE